MKQSIVRLLLVLGSCLSINLPQHALAQSEPQNPLPPHIWGMVSNGICVGIRIRQSDWATNKDDFFCDIDVRNMSTNRFYIWVPSLEWRYEIELRGPDGRQIRQLKPLVLSQKHSWLVREPILDEKHSLDWFLLKETFDIQTNGIHTLIVSARVNAFTNFVFGHSKMRGHSDYFLLPPVTNMFNIIH